MKKGILTTAVILLSAASFVYAETEKDDEKELGISLDLTYTSKWLSKGIEAYGSKGGFFKTIDIDFYGTGFGFRVTHRNATSSGYVDQQRIDYQPYYKGSLFEDTNYMTKFDISVAYESYTGLAAHKANTTYEWVGAFSWPKLIGHGLTPGYILHCEYPAFSGEANRHNAGNVHRFLLAYDLNVSDLQNPLKLTTEVAYYDGLGNRVSDWAYFTAGVSTKFNITEDICLVPGLYHQVTMDESISQHKDITYTMVSMKFTF